MTNLTYAAILGEARASFDPGDPFAWVQGYRFAICQVLAFHYDVFVPGFRPGAATAPEDSAEVADVEYAGRINPSDVAAQEGMLQALVIFDRYREWLRIAGRDY